MGKGFHVPRAKGRQPRTSSESLGVGVLAFGRGFGPSAMLLGVLLLLAHLTHGDAERSSVQQLLRMPKGTIAGLRSKRSADHVIEDCIMVTSEEGEYFYKAPPAGADGEEAGGFPPVCGVYFLTDPERRVELSLHYLRAPCAAGGLISFMDGWELNEELFPSIEDHPLPLKDRFQEYCSGSAGGIVVNGGRGSGLQAASKKRKKERLSTTVIGSALTLTSSQNAGLVQYRVPPSVRGVKGRSPDVYGFSFSVRFPKNPTPCNILVEDTSNVYTLRNYGRAVNCSLATLFPARLRVLSLSVGSTPGGVPAVSSNSIHLSQSNAIKRNMEVETGTIHKCEKRGMPDYVEVGGAPGLDISNLAVSDSICGMDSRPGSTVETILCGVSTVRMVSSGWFDNAVTVALRQAADNDVPEATLVCPSPMELPEDLGELAAELGEAGLEGFAA